MKEAKDILKEMYGEKETYTRHETLIAMIEYAIYHLEQQSARMMKTIKEAMS